MSTAGVLRGPGNSLWMRQPCLTGLRRGKLEPRTAEAVGLGAATRKSRGPSPPRRKSSPLPAVSRSAPTLPSMTVSAR